MIKLLFIGNSHTGAIRRAATLWEKRGRTDVKVLCIHIREAKYVLTTLEKSQGVQVSTTLKKDISHLASKGFRLISCVGGNAYNVLGLVQSSRPFDFLLGDEIRGDLDPDREVVPSAIIRKALIRRDKTYLEIVKFLATLGVFQHLCAPPPIRSNDYIRTYAEDVFFSWGLGHLGVSPASLRLKLWKLQTELQGIVLSPAGVELVSPPPQAIDPNGFLKEAFAATDATHGNTAYGELVIELFAQYFINKKGVAS